MDFPAVALDANTLRLLTNKETGLNDGERVLVTIERGRSMTSHRHQFAWVKDAWLNLPESVMFSDWAATPETLRKEALIQCGYYHQIAIGLDSAKTAREVAHELKAARALAHGYAQAVVRDGMAVVRWPESQSVKAMGGKRFQESKTAIIEWIADQLGVHPSELRGAA